MNLTMRGWSLNTYCLTKTWFRTHSVDLRVQDIKKITSNVKRWLYGDMLLKPEEIIMSRPTSFGGLSVHNVGVKALAGLITTFLETACNPKYRRSLYHSNLFRFHVLDDNSIPDPGFPPFYSKNFFQVIKKVHTESALNVCVMSEGQWYRLLLEDNVTMEEMENGQRKYIGCRVELASPETDWQTTWRLSRLPGLGSEHTSFLFKLLHQILPTQERVARTSPAASPTCKVNNCTGDVVEDLSHALVHCQGNHGVGLKVVQIAETLVAGAGAERLLLLDVDVDEGDELALVWWLAAGFLAIWNMRTVGKRVELYLVRTQIKAKINLLQDTHFAGVVPKREGLLNLMGGN